MKVRTERVSLLLTICAWALAGHAAHAAGIGPVLEGALPAPLPLFPADNWWNADITAAQVDPASASFISFVNNGGTRKLHPDFGGDVSTGSVQNYGMSYAVVDGTQTKKTVVFQYADESDGVDHATNTSFAFYPIPDQAITQNHWVEGGEPGSVDLRNSADRHILVVDRDNKTLYELWNAWYDTAHAQWNAGSGAFFDMKTNNRRPDGWTSADAAGLAILPGLVRYDEAYDPAVTDLNHALRVTVRSTNGYVYPASHRAGSTTGALPMGARLRLKASKDISGFTPEVQKIFRAMKKYGLIVADNGSDMYISGTYDNRWNNDVLNPAFSGLSASDFEVVQLGWKPTQTQPVSLSSIAVSPASAIGGQQNATGTATLSGAAPAGGVSVSLTSSAPAAASVPASVTALAGFSAATFPVTTAAVASPTGASISGTYAGTTKSASITVNPVPPPPPATLAALSLNPTAVVGGSPSTGTVTLSAAAPAGGIVVALSSSSSVAAVPASITVPAGATSKTFTVTTVKTNKNISAVVSAKYAGVTKTSTLTVKRR